MKTRHNIIRKLVMGFGCWVLMAACSSDTVTDNEEPLPEGMGRIRITICTPENNPELTRAVNANPWKEPDHEWERLQTFRILICKKSNNEVVQIISGTKAQMSIVPEPSDPSDPKYPYKRSAEIKSAPLDAGDYYIYATANYADGYTVGNTVDPDAIVTFPNGYSSTGTTLFGGDDATNTITKPIPMTGKLTDGDDMKTVEVTAGSDTDAGTITVWRVMSKLEFNFTNEATEQIKIYGIEVEPINTDDSNQGLIYLFSQDVLTSTDNLAVGGVTLPSGVTNGKVKHPLTTPTDPLLTLAAKNDGDTDEGTLFFYVNETNGTFTTTENEISLRFKIKRGDASEEELRYGLTTHYGDGSEGQNGFNVIRRNDWIHIPIILTDWQMRIEPLAFVPIAGYPAATVSSDGLTATYSTGGMIALQPFIKKKNDATWRNFGDPEVTFVSISWKTSDPSETDPNPSGDGKIVKTPFTYDPVNQFITGELNSAKVGHDYKTTITVNVDLGKDPDPVYHYTFSCNVILD